MKKIWKCAVMILITTSAQAQITLEAVRDSMWLDEEFKTVQISPTETKWYFRDTITNTFSLYNMDYTPFITNIAVPAPFMSAQSFGHFSVVYVTRSLFDCDTSNIEFVYEAPTSLKPLWIMRTDGTVLLQVDSANLPYCSGCRAGTDDVRPVVNTSDGTKLFIQKAGIGHSKVLVYALCGSLPTHLSVYDENFNESFIQIFPNPASGSLTFKVNTPDNINEYQFVIVDGSARELKRETVRGRGVYELDVSTFNNGTYFYSICTKNQAYQNGKFIVNH